MEPEVQTVATCEHDINIIIAILYCRSRSQIETVFETAFLLINEMNELAM